MTTIIDVSTRSVVHDGVESPLTEREFAVLQVLSRGSVVSRGELIRDAGLADLSARRCESVIMSLRQILGADAIVNLRRRGWRLTIDVELRP